MCGVAGGSAGAGGFEGAGAGARFPVGALCLDAEYRNTLVQGLAAVGSVQGAAAADHALGRALRALPAWLHDRARQAFTEALGHDGVLLLMRDGLTSVPVCVDTPRFPAWRAAVWPAADQRSITEEPGLLAALARLIAAPAQAVAVHCGGGGGSRGGGGVGALVEGGLGDAVRGWVEYGVVESARAPSDFAPYQKLLWLATQDQAAQDGQFSIAAGQNPDATATAAAAASSAHGGGGSGGSVADAGRRAYMGGGKGGGRGGMERRRAVAAGLLQEALLCWHTRSWNASYLEVHTLCSASLLPYDRQPSRRERSRTAEGGGGEGEWIARWAPRRSCCR